MDRQFWMVLLGVVAIAIYTLSWVFQLFEIPGKNYLRIAAALPFLAGLGLLLYDRYKKSQYQNKHKANTWDDLLGDEEE